MDMSQVNPNLTICYARARNQWWQQSSGSGVRLITEKRYTDQHKTT